MLALVWLTLGQIAWAEESGVWTFDTENYSVDGYSGTGGEVTIPATLENCPSEILGDGLFYGNQTITGVTVPEGCNTIERNAFYFCENMENVSLPESLQVIGDYAFGRCERLTSLRIPAAVGYIGEYAFSDCAALCAVTFEGEAPDLGANAWNAIAQDAAFYVPDDRVEAYRSVLPEGANVQPSGKSAVTVGYLREEFTFDAATGTVTAYNGYAPIVAVPAEIDGVRVTAIGENAFLTHRYVYRVDIPEGVTAIGPSAFKSAWVLEDVNLPSTLRTLGEEAFLGFHGARVAFPEGLESIGQRAFAYSSLSEELSLPEGVKEIGAGAFSHCSWLKEASLPASLASIGDGAFAESGLAYLYLDGTALPEIAANAFEGCTKLADIDLNTACTKAQMLSLQASVDALGLSCRVWRNQNPEVAYPSDDLMTFDGSGLVTGYAGTITHLRPYDSYGDVQTVGVADGAFRGNSVVRYFSVPYNDAFTAIGAEAFADSALETVDLFDSVTSIGAGAFENSALTTVKGGEALETIGERAFAGTHLTDYVIPAGIDVSPSAFEGVPPEGLRLPKNATQEQVDFWSEALRAPWYQPLLREGEESAFVPMPFEATPEAFFTVDSATGLLTAYTGADVDVVVPRTVDGVTVTGIGYAAFETARDYTDTEMTSNQTDWVRMRSLVLPETVTFLDDSAFSYCQQLETFVCYGPLESTGKGTFLLCKSLQNVVFVNGVRVIDNYCFDSAGALEVTAFGNHLEAIGERAFHCCGVARLVVNAKALANSAISDCPNLTELHFTSRVERAETGAIDGCSNLSLVCFETDDLSFLPDEGMVFGPGRELTVRTPEGLSEDMLRRAERLVGWDAEMPAVTYVTDACARAPEAPDAAALAVSLLR